MFPIIDVRGNVIGFSGRILNNQDKSAAKYLNSPETLIFNKRKNLFALNLAKKSKLGYLILVEGYMDAIALHQYGFDCAVASLGTALTEDGANLLSRYTEQAVLIYGYYPFSVTNRELARDLCEQVNRQAIFGSMLLLEKHLAFRTGADLFDAYSAYEHIGRALEYNAGIMVRFWNQAASCAAPKQGDLGYISISQ